jgi:NADH dehydrogenase
MAAPTPGAQPDRHVVVIGGGFGGLEAVKVLARSGADVTLVDRNNYHLFQPLSYQVATGALAPGEIAIPLRHVFRRRKRVRVLLGEVSRLDLAHRQIVVEDPAGGTDLVIGYDQLIVAAGSDYSYFGNEQWRAVALEVKSLDSALEVRGRILHAFEEAELKPAEQDSWMTFLIVGGGPTGVEMAGQIAELARDTLPGEYRSIDTRRGRVLLVEMGDKVLSAFPDPLPARAARSLEQLGVTLVLGHQVVDITASSVTTQDRQGARNVIPTRTVVWAAGVTASPLARALADASGASVDRDGRLTVEPDLSLRGHSEVLAVGDMVSVREPSGDAKTFPGLAPVAMQQGRYAGGVIAARLTGRAAPPPFRYRDKGMLATIGRDRAVGEVWKLRFSGVIAWVAWLLVHIYYLIGFQNRLVVMIRWAYSYATRGRGSRLITGAAGGQATARRSSGLTRTGPSPPSDRHPAPAGSPTDAS